MVGTLIDGTESTNISIANSKIGDLYFNSSTGNVYECTAQNFWVYRICLKDADVVAPEVTIDELTGLWMVDGKPTGVKAQGEQGSIFDRA